jgi:hypothetical protein
VADPVDEVAGRLYGLPLEDFTRERDAAARELRKAKERDVADVVAKLPKPTQAAWAANALAREHRDLVDDLLAAGDELREAQEAAVAGKGAEALREATAAEREAVDALMAVAKDLKPGGRKPTAATLEKLRTTLEAAATDDDVRAALEQGRVVADAEGGGAWGLLAGADVPATRPRKPARKRAKAATSKQEAAQRAAAEERLQEERAGNGSRPSCARRAPPAAPATASSNGRRRPRTARPAASRPRWRRPRRRASTRMRRTPSSTPPARRRARRATRSPASRSSSIDR